MKTIVKLLIALVILNAVARGAIAAWSYYQFRDAAAELVLFGGTASTSELHTRIASRAAELEVPVAPENISVQRDGARTWADVTYTQPIEYFPRRTYPVELSFTVDAFSTAGATPR
jgi:hypothetical protein